MAVSGKAATVIAAMSQENKFEVKNVILIAYELRPEAYRQKFRNYRKKGKQFFFRICWQAKYFVQQVGQIWQNLTRVMTIWDSLW